MRRPIGLHHRMRPSSARRTSRSHGRAKGGKSSVRRGEIRWYTFAAPNKRRPVLLLTRDAVIDGLNEIIVVPATRTIRGIATEVVLTIDDGMPAACALNFDYIALARRDRVGPTITTLSPERWAEAERALLIACGFAEPTVDR